MLESSSAEKHLTTLFAFEDLLWKFKACWMLQVGLILRELLQTQMDSFISLKHLKLNPLKV